MAVWELSAEGFSLECEGANPIPFEEPQITVLLTLLSAWKIAMPETTELKLTQDNVDLTRYKFRVTVGARNWRQDYFPMEAGVKVEFGNITGAWYFREYSLVTALRPVLLALCGPPYFCTRIEAVWS